MTSRLRSSLEAAARLGALAATALVLVATSRPLPKPPGDCAGGGKVVAVRVTGDCGPEGDARIRASPGACRFTAESAPPDVLPASGYYRGDLAELELGPDVEWRRPGDGGAPSGTCGFAQPAGRGVELECVFWSSESGKVREVGRCTARIALQAGAPAAGGER